MKTYTVFSCQKIPQKRLYMFSISIHLMSLPFRGFNCEAISLFSECLSNDLNISECRFHVASAFQKCVFQKPCQLNSLDQRGGIRVQRRRADQQRRRMRRQSGPVQREPCRPESEESVPSPGKSEL